eukprot:m51a1_g4231 hypothetical protein (227) ;mRNA; f:123198-123878
MTLNVWSFPVGPMMANCVLVADSETHEAVCVDPGDDVLKILAQIRRRNARVVAIALTHVHVDHVAAAAALKSSLPASVPVLSHAGDRRLFYTLAAQCRLFGVPEPDFAFPRGPDGELRDGAGVLEGVAGVASEALRSGRVLHTPGHSAGSVCLHWACAGVVVTGDTLFHNGTGRTDLQGGDAAALRKSIAERLFTLPPETRVMPGHDVDTTIGVEMARPPKPGFSC